MSERLYSPREADRALVLIHPVVEDVRRYYISLRGELSALRDLELLAEITSDQSVPAPLRARLAELQTCLDELRILGAVLLDPEIGLVSLPGRLEGDVRVQLCWKLGEDRVRFWYPAGGSYADRRPIAAPATA